MGFDLGRFKVQPVSYQFICFYCKGVLEDPLQCPDHHLFCGECIRDYMEVVQLLNNDAHCPFDGRILLEDELTFPDQMILCMWGSLEVGCDHRERGCENYVSLAQLESHSKRCHFNPDMQIRCPNECGARFKIGEGHKCVDYMRGLVREKEIECRRREYLFKDIIKNLEMRILELKSKSKTRWMHTDIKPLEIKRKVTCYQFDSEKVVIAFEKMVEVFSYEKIKALKLLTGHESKVIWLQFNDRILVTGSREDIRTWDPAKDWLPVQVITGVNEFNPKQFPLNPNAIKLGSNKLSLCTGGSLVVYRLNEDTRELSLWEQIPTVSVKGFWGSLDMDNNYIACGRYGVEVWGSADLKVAARLLVEDKSVVNAVKLHKGRVFAGLSGETELIIWDIVSGEVINKIIGRMGSMVTHLYLSDAVLVMIDKSNNVIILDIDLVLDVDVAWTRMRLNSISMPFRPPLLKTMQIDENQIIALNSIGKLYKLFNGF